MLKANFKSVFFITLVTTFTLLIGCSSPEEKKAAQIKDALSLSAAGSNAEALDILENLATLYPNDLEILNSIGQIYTAQGDPTMAAFYLEQAYLQSPDDTELLFKTYQSLEAAKQPAAHLLEKFAAQAPDAMTPALWVRLGQTRQAKNEVQPALDAYLKGVDPDKRKPAPETAAAIGQLFVKAGNLPLAESWLKIAADNDDPNALTALFALLEINLRQKDWVDAEATITQLNKQFPGAVEASQWKQAQQELVRWRKAQNDMKAKLAQAEAQKQAAQAAAAKVAAAAAKAKAEQAATEKAAAEKAQAAQAIKTGTIATIQIGDINQADDSEPTATGGKAQIIADLEAAEAMADAPAIEGEMPSDFDPNITIVEATGNSNQVIAFNPNIAIEPADPEITFEVNYDQAPIAEGTNYSITTPTPVEPAPAQTIELAPEIEAYPPIEAFPTYQAQAPLEPIRPSARPRTIEELLADAETATLDRDFKSAIRKYWAAISIANNRADVWNQLSRAYLIDGQLKNAETTALEAVRLEPREVAYTLDYLRVAQRSKEPSEFLAELETAYDRFPTSPEITLSLARGHERISKDRATARNLYLRFIDTAPNHPLVPEARAAVARLR